jgi:hypothetical protein
LHRLLRLRAVSAADRARAEGDPSGQRQEDGDSHGPPAPDLPPAPLPSELAVTGVPFTFVHRKGAKHKRKHS